jgi:fimbrial chaperone protein
MHRWLLGLLTAVSCHSSVFAGAFGVSPIRIDLDPGTRTGLITVTNDDDRKLYFQLALFEWTQNASGEDQYADSSDLLFFPQIFTVDPKDKRLVRVGLKAPPLERERAFRLFIEEMPDPNAVPGTGAQIAVRLRFGVPIFLSAGKGASQPEVISAEASKGILRVAIRNTGTRQIRFEEVAMRDGDKTVAKTAGWYVFPGATRLFTLPVPPGDCPVPSSVEIRATADGKVVSKMVEVPPALCSP